MDKRIQEAVDLFQQVLIYGTERVLRSVEDPLWNEYSPEQMQVLNIIGKEGAMTAGRIATLQGVHKSAVSNRLKKLKDRELLHVLQSDDKREKLLDLTDKGRLVVKHTNQVLHGYIEKLLINQVNDQEIEQFLTTFRKLKEIMKTNGE